MYLILSDLRKGYWKKCATVLNPQKIIKIGSAYNGSKHTIKEEIITGTRQSLAQFNTYHSKKKRFTSGGLLFLLP